MNYVPAAAVASPDQPYLAEVADDEASSSEQTRAVIQAPVVCQLCGAGFLAPEGLWKHAAAEHHSWAEYRKRLIFEVQQRHSVPLQPVEKRRLAGNFMRDLLHSYPSRNSLRRGSWTMRQIVACAMCALKGWIEDFYPCYLFKEMPGNGSAAEHAREDAGATDHGGDAEAEGGDGSAEEEEMRRKGPALRDAENFCYLGPAQSIHALLDVELYIPVVPLAPLEELQ